MSFVVGNCSPSTPQRQHCIFPFISEREWSDTVSFLRYDKANHNNSNTIHCDDGGMILELGIIEPRRRPFVAMW